MGKSSKAQQQQHLHDQFQLSLQTTDLVSSSYYCHTCCCCSISLHRIRNSCSFKCFLVLIISAALFLSALFWIPPFNRLNPGFDANVADDVFAAAAKASFRLQKTVLLLATHTKTLESDILGEIGVPNTKISILSTHQYGASNWTDVVFGVVPDPKTATINLVSLSVLRSSLIELFLHQSNLSLTTTIFGQPSSFEILKFTGGITVAPVQSGSIWQIPQILFTFSLNNSISQIRDYFDQLKDQLKYGLGLRFDENLYVQLTNTNGSTVMTPVSVQVSIFSSAGSAELLPQRLKQLAQTITGSPGKNLGLDHSVFGKVKGVSLSSVLNKTLETSSKSPAPSPSPSPSERNYHSAPSISPHPALSPSYSSPSDGHNLSPCSDYDCSFPHAPSPKIAPEAPVPSTSESLAPSPLSISPMRSPRHGFAVSPSPVPTTQLDPPIPPDFPRAAAPRPMGPTQNPFPELSPSSSASYSTSPGPDKRRAIASEAPSSASSALSPSLSSLGHRNMWLIGSLAAFILHHLAC